MSLAALAANPVPEAVGGEMKRREIQGRFRSLFSIFWASLIRPNCIVVACIMPDQESAEKLHQYAVQLIRAAEAEKG